MNALKIFLALCLTAALSTACNKDNEGDHNNLQGIWQGNWGSGSQKPLYFIKFDFKNNGQLQRLDEQNKVIATGNWSLNGIEFECTYTHTTDGQVHKIGGLYTDFDGHITGTWGYHPSKANGGNLELKKQ